MQLLFLSHHMFHHAISAVLLMTAWPRAGLQSICIKDKIIIRFEQRKSRNVNSSSWDLGLPEDPPVCTDHISKSVLSWACKHYTRENKQTSATIKKYLLMIDNMSMKRLSNFTKSEKDLIFQSSCLFSPQQDALDK